jgi:pseudaminic acid biosynthesis-associated methylase
MGEEFRTTQETFWAGDFGERYIERNKSSQLRASNLALFAKILGRTGRIGSVLELGANIGLNLEAIAALEPECELTGVEINELAHQHLARVPGVTALHMSALNFVPDRRFDLVLTKTFLIHVSPDHLPGIYDVIHRSAGRFVCIAEYYNPSPMTVPYRGFDDRLFKRDFAGELLDRHPDLELFDYGFCYRGDPVFPQDDITWFLLRRT